MATRKANILRDHPRAKFDPYEHDHGHDSFRKLQVHHVSIQAADGRMAVLENFIAPEDYGSKAWAVGATRRQLLEHIQTQVNNQLAIRALEGQ